MLRKTLDTIKSGMNDYLRRKWRRFREIMKSERTFFDWFVTKKISHYMPDSLYLKQFYKVYMNEKLDLRNPRSYNQKLQWLKLYDRNPLHTQLSDKYFVREYVEQRIGSKYLVPLLGVYSSFDEIDFSSLPNRFVLKTTHDSGGIVICDNLEKFDRVAAASKLNAHLNRNYYYWGREWNYKNIHPQIVAEKFLEDTEHNDLYDYKFMCCEGHVKCCLVGSKRFKSGLNLTFFDLDWNVMPFNRGYPRSTDPIAKPKRFDDMVQLAEKLSHGIPFVRVDLYAIDDAIYFGEMSFHPGSGIAAFTPVEWDYRIGEWLNLEKAYCYTKGKKA